MGYNICEVENRKVVWLIAMVLASVILIEYLEQPYRDRMLTLISTGKGYFSFSDFNGTQSGDDGFKENITENSIGMNHNAEIETIGGTISIAPVMANDTTDISPSVTYRAEISIAPSPISSDFSVAPVYAPSDELSPTMYNPPAPTNKVKEHPVKSVVSISEMNDMLLRNRVSLFSGSSLWSSDTDEELLYARYQIENATIIRDHFDLSAPIFRNISTFSRSYEIMEQKLKVYIYKDGQRPVFHQPKLKGIYASEGWFMKLLEANKQYLTNNSSEAHLFYLPFSSQLLVDYVYVKDSHTFVDINNYLKNYIDYIKARYPFWNRTDGSDHFLVACHDWAPVETRHLMANCVRALCNSDVKEGFQLGKDVSLPETSIHSPQKPMKDIGGNSPSQRKILAFFAGQMHGYVRPILLKHWKNKDPDMKIVGKMRKGYAWHMKNSKYCICAKGYEVNSPRVVEAIIYGCVPVIISDNFVPPFFEMLNWESFTVFVLEKDIPNLKNILVLISKEKYVMMQQRVKEVRQHFVWHDPPVKYDIFHMILHSIWYNRVFRLNPR